MTTPDNHINIDISKLVADKLKAIDANKEKLIEAWVAETGIHPTESCLIQQELGTTTRFWIEPQINRCATHRSELTKLLHQFETATNALKAIARNGSGFQYKHGDVLISAPQYAAHILTLLGVSIEDKP